MPTHTLDPAFQGLLNGRYVATLGTENGDGTIHLTAVWYLFEAGSLYARRLPGRKRPVMRRRGRRLR